MPAVSAGDGCVRCGAMDLQGVSVPRRESWRTLRLRLLSQLDQTTGREKAVLRKAVRSLEARLRREHEERGPGRGGGD